MKVTREPTDEGQKAFADIVARYYGDPEFRATLEADPAGAMREAGLDFPEGLNVKLLFNTDRLMHVVLPAPGRVTQAVGSSDKG